MKKRTCLLLSLILVFCAADVLTVAIKRICWPSICRARSETMTVYFSSPMGQTSSSREPR